MRSSLNHIWKTGPSKDRFAHHLETQLLSLVFVLAAGLLLVVSLTVSAVAAAFEKHLTGRLTLPAVVLQGVNMGGTFALFMFLFAMIYKILPQVKIAWHDAWVGAAVTAFLLTAGNSFLGIYLGKFCGASAYGTAGAVVLILAWTYYCAQILYLGAEFTRVYAEARQTKR